LGAENRFQSGFSLASSALVVRFGPLATPVKEEKVTKSEFVDQVAAESGLSKSDSANAVDAFLGVVEETLRRGGEVSFTGFGKFSVAERGARQGVNPQTGERIHIPAGRVPRFSAGSGLKKSVKGSF
jgi:DNA-binding protein HU-beta